MNIDLYNRLFILFLEILISFIIIIILVTIADLFETKCPKCNTNKYINKTGLKGTLYNQKYCSKCDFIFFTHI